MFSSCVQQPPVSSPLPQHYYLKIIDLRSKADPALTLHHNGDGLVGAAIDGQVVHFLLSAHHPGKLGVHKHVPAVMDVTEGEAGWVGLTQGEGKKRQVKIFNTKRHE